MTTPPLLPEIGDILADHLKCQDLYACIRVCRAWYHIFIAYLWTTLHMKSPQERLPTLATVQAHAHLIRSLNLENYISLQYLSADYRGLKALHLKDTLTSEDISDEFKDEVQQLMLRILCSNPELDTISLDGCDISPTARFWKACLERPDGFQYISLCGVNIDENSLPWCWAALARSRRVTFSSSQWGISSHASSSATAPCWPDPALRPITQQIEILQLSGVSVWQQWQFMVQCSEATEIRWQPCPRDGVSVREASALSLRHIITPGLWTRLKRLDLTKSRLSDDAFSDLLKCSNPLSDLRAPNTRFGTLATRVLLLRHITALQYLDLSSCDKMTSPDIQQILTSGVQLETFMAYRLQVEELVSPDSRPWACTKIKSLRLFFDTEFLDPYAANELVFTQLARLSNIQVLSTSLTRRLDMEWMTLMFRLDMGLNIVAGLRDLRELHVLNTHQILRTEDAEWMAKHWCLTRVEGSLNSNEKTHKALYNIIMRRRELR